MRVLVRPRCNTAERGGEGVYRCQMINTEKKMFTNLFIIKFKQNKVLSSNLSQISLADKTHSRSSPTAC